KTHKSDAIIAALQSLLLGDRLEKNTNIETRNNAWRIKHFNHVSDPATHKDDASDSESMITIDGDELATLCNPEYSLYSRNTPRPLLPG
ncbi:hypothetical protein ARMGADRAFT_924862, partial [Armillaria gallica]